MFTPPKKKQKDVNFLCILLFCMKNAPKNTFKHPPMLIRYTFSSSAEQAGGADVGSP